MSSRGHGTMWRTLSPHGGPRVTFLPFPDKIQFYIDTEFVRVKSWNGLISQSHHTLSQRIMALSNDKVLPYCFAVWQQRFNKNNKCQKAIYMPNIGRTENVSTVPCSKFRGASFLKSRLNLKQLDLHSFWKRATFRRHVFPQTALL